MTQKEAVYSILKSRRWIPASEIMAVAGSESGLRRTRELRQDGYEIRTRRTNGEFEYRLVGRS